LRIPAAAQSPITNESPLNNQQSNSRNPHSAIRNLQSRDSHATSLIRQENRGRSRWSERSIRDLERKHEPALDLHDRMIDTTTKSSVIRKPDSAHALSQAGTADLLFPKSGMANMTR
jgi:hypothetical protein